VTPVAQVDLHPEDLLEREIRGELSPAELERLEAHARLCSVCRLERLVRTDFLQEAEAEAQIDLQRVLAAVTDPRRGAQGAPGSLVRSRMRRFRAMLLVAALITVTGFAGAGVARWSSYRALAATIGLSVESPSPSLVQETTPARRKARAALSVAPAATKDLVEDALVASAAEPTPEPAHAVGTPKALAAAAPVAAPAGVGVVPLAAPAGLASLAPKSPVPALGGPGSAMPGPDAATIFRRANETREMGDHTHAAVLYGRLLEEFPTAPEARAALPMFARMLLDDGNAAGALRRFDQALRLGAGALQEDVMLGRALALQHLLRSDEEANAWSALIDAYPYSVHAARARRRLLELASR
jgi:hypothetical protein